MLLSSANGHNKMEFRVDCSGKFMNRCLALFLSASILHGFAPAAFGAGLDQDEVRRAATTAHSLFLDSTGRVSAIETFIDLVRIKGPSGNEQAVAEEIKSLLSRTGAVFARQQTTNPKAPHNLVMEIPASGALPGQQAILLNAHLDTIKSSTPELLAFDPGSRDCYHPDESSSPKISYFGGDDRSAVAVIVECVRVLHTKYWSHGVAHRRLVLVFTAEEEVGCLGAKYLSRHEPELFNNAKFTLSMDGPLDLHSKYPEDSFVAVCLETDRSTQPYKNLLELFGRFCERSKTRFGNTEVGLGMGDFAFFPPSARAGLHLRSPVRGWHNKERVNLQDQINHIDLLCYLLLGFDGKIPAGL